MSLGRSNDTEACSLCYLGFPPQTWIQIEIVIHQYVVLGNWTMSCTELHSLALKYSSTNIHTSLRAAQCVEPRSRVWSGPSWHRDSYWRDWDGQIQNYKELIEVNLKQNCDLGVIFMQILNINIGSITCY